MKSWRVTGATAVASFEQGAPVGGEFDGRGCHQAIGPQVVKHRHDVRGRQAELALAGEEVDQLGVAPVR